VNTWCPWSKPLASSALICAVAAAAAFLITRQVRAYDDYDSYACGFVYGGSGTLQIPYKNDATYPPTGIYLTAFNQAQWSWDAGATPAVFVPSSTNHTRAVKANGSGNPRGHIDRYCSPWYRTSTAWFVNSSHPDVSGSDFWKQSAAAHESGHHIWTSHSTYTNAIMNPNRTGGNNGPIQDDFCAVQYRYPSATWPLQCGYPGGP